MARWTVRIFYGNRYRRAPTFAGMTVGSLEKLLHPGDERAHLLSESYPRDTSSDIKSFRDEIPSCALLLGRCLKNYRANAAEQADEFKLKD